MKTKMMIAALASLMMGSSIAGAAEQRVAAAGNLRALVRPAAERPEPTRYQGLERVRDSFRDGSHGRGR